MSTSEPRLRDWPRLLRLAVAAVALMPAACIDFGLERPSNPLAGVWITADHSKVTLRDDTVVLTSPGGAPTPITAAECAGGFFFHYGQMSRASLTGIAAAQPDVDKKLSGLLVEPAYSVAELGCDHGTSTYVLLDDRNLVAIYRDRDVVGLDRMSRL
jgi:hypothetical protein